MFNFSDDSSLGTGNPPTSPSNHHSSADESEDESVSMGSSGSSWTLPPEAMLDDQDSITEGFASDEEQNAMEDDSVTFPVIPGTAYYGDGRTDHDKIPDPDIDMIYARGSPDMLLIPLQAGFIDFGGHVERRSDMQGKVRVGNGTVQVWINSSYKPDICHAFSSKRKGYFIKSNSPQEICTQPYRLSGPDFLDLLQECHVEEVTLLQYGQKSSLKSGASLMNHLRFGDSECSIKYDIAFYQPTPNRRELQGDHMCPLGRFSNSAARQGLGQGVIVRHKIHSFLTQMRYLQSTQVPQHGSYNIERVGDNDVNNPAFVEFAELLLKGKGYGTLAHAIKARTRTDFNYANCPKTLRKVLKETFIEQAYTDLFLRDHYFRHEATIQLPISSRHQYSIDDADGLPNVAQFFSHAWPCLQFLRNNVDLLWIPSEDLCSDIYHLCTMFSVNESPHLPSPIHRINPFTRDNSETMTEQERKMAALVFAACGISTDR